MEFEVEKEGPIVQTQTVYQESPSDQTRQFDYEKMTKQKLIIRIYVTNDPECYYLDRPTLIELRRYYGELKSNAIGLPNITELDKYSNNNHLEDYLYSISLKTLKEIKEDFDIEYIYLQSYKFQPDYENLDINQFDSSKYTSHSKK